MKVVVFGLVTRASDGIMPVTIENFVSPGDNHGGARQSPQFHQDIHDRGSENR